MQGLVYIDGEYVSPDEATISLFDTGFQLGLNVFDTMPLYRGRLFRLDAHIERFCASMKAARLDDLRATAADLRRIVIETVRRSGLRDAAVTVIATRGVRQPGARLWDLQPTLIVQCIGQTVFIKPEQRVSGSRACITTIRGIPSASIPPQVKHYNRLPNYLAILEARDRGVDDSMAIFVDDHDHVTEGASFNVFAVRAGELHTPADGVLRGITRDTVLRIADGLGVRAHQDVLSRYDLFMADEVFATSVSRGAVAIVEIDGRRIGDGSPGPLTRRIDDIYWSWRLEGPYTLDVYAEVPADGQAAPATTTR
jgi:branched-chain amino acid aminotransferase